MQQRGHSLTVHGASPLLPAPGAALPGRTMLSGTIRYYDEDSGQGFIEPHAGPIVAHIFVAPPHLRPVICRGMNVSYGLSDTAGRTLAIEIRPL